jgi:hypothetical protein
MNGQLIIQYYQKEMQKIINKNVLLGIIVREEHWKSGLTFVTDDNEYIQVGLWNYNSGRLLDNHVHKNYERSASLTQECVFVVSGSMLVKFFDSEMSFLEEHELSAGDMAVLLRGGHGYEILEDGTRVIESKNGPFVSVEKDKVKF